MPTQYGAEGSQELCHRGCKCWKGWCHVFGPYVCTKKKIRDELLCVNESLLSGMMGYRGGEAVRGMTQVK